METLVAIFVRVVLPVFLMVVIGYAAGCLMPLDERTLSRLGLYVLVPCMVFAAMARTALSMGELGQIVLFYLLSTVLLYLVSLIAARLLRLDAELASAFHISILFGNVVNVGFPVLLLAYGQSAVERGLVFAICMQIALQSFGVYLAARGKADAASAMRRVWQMPGLYALIVGLAVNFAHIDVPAFIYDPIKIIGDSLVPLLLLLLGMQLTHASFRGHLLAASVATVLRLVVAVVIASLLAGAMGLPTITRQSMIVESGMPTAIFGVVLAQEFETAPDLVTVVISLSSLASILTLTVLLAIVG